MTNREKLIELLTEKDGKVNYPAIHDLLSMSPLDFYCDLGQCKGAHYNCSVCTAQWLNEEAEK